MTAWSLLIAVMLLSCGESASGSDAGFDTALDTVQHDTSSGAQGFSSGQSVTDPFNSPRDGYGSMVAVSADGNTVAVGAPGESSDAVGINGDPTNTNAPFSGAAFIYVRSGNGWSLQAYIKSPNAQPDELLGWQLDLSADGNTLVVGAIHEREGGSGAAYVFHRSGTTWTVAARLKASNPVGGGDNADLFGSAVAVSADGTTIAVGAIGEDSAAVGINGDQNDESAVDSGAVYVFARSGNTWSQHSYLKASNTGRGDWFGTKLALSSDGSTLAVSAQAEASAASGIDGDQSNNGLFASGAVYVFVRSGSQWSQQAYLKASNTTSNCQFGSSLAFSALGDRLAVGSIGESSTSVGIDGIQMYSEAGLGSGAAYLFERTGVTWTQSHFVKAPNTERFDNFGESVDLSDDGSVLAVGTRYEASAATGIAGNQLDNTAAETGAVYILSVSAGTWSHQQYIKPINAGKGEHFGASLALSRDATLLVVGAPGPFPTTPSFGGRMYIYE